MLPFKKKNIHCFKLLNDFAIPYLCNISFVNILLIFSVFNFNCGNENCYLIKNTKFHKVLRSKDFIDN